MSGITPKSQGKYTGMAQPTPTFFGLLYVWNYNEPLWIFFVYYKPGISKHCSLIQRPEVVHFEGNLLDSYR